MDWKDVLKTAAPILTGLATGGPVGMGIGAVRAIANVLGVDSTEEAVAAAVQNGLSPEQRVALSAADAQVKTALINAGVREKEIGADVEKTYIQDVADARSHNANTVGILRLGYLINVMSYACLFAVLYGSYRLVSGGDGVKIDPTVAAMLGGVVGAAVQWLMSNAAQANGFFFGSSPSGRQVASDLAKATAATASGKQ